MKLQPPYAAPSASIWLSGCSTLCLQDGWPKRGGERKFQGMLLDVRAIARAVRCGGNEYEEALDHLLRDGLPAPAVCEGLMLAGARRAADALRPIFEKTGGREGYVTMPLPQRLAHDSAALVAAGERLINLSARPNIMLALPATPAGCRALRTLIAAGYSAGIGPLFSPAHYRYAARSYLNGLEHFYTRQETGDARPQRPPASIAAFSLAPLDRATTGQQPQANSEPRERTALAVAWAAYARYEALVASPRWQRLARRGSHPQRLLWQDTIPPSYAYPPTWYVDALADTDTILALAPPTYAAQAQVDAGEGTRVPDRDGAPAIDLDDLAASLQADQLQREAIAARALEESVEERRAQGAAGPAPPSVGLPRVTLHAGPARPRFTRRVARAAREQLVSRIWQSDPALWAGAGQPALGWLHAPQIMDSNCRRLEAFREEVCRADYGQVVVVGADAALRAAHLFAETFGRLPAMDGANSPPYRADTTVTTLATEEIAAFGETLVARPQPAPLFVLVEGKEEAEAGSQSPFTALYAAVAALRTERRAGAHFVAIARPGSPLATLARSHHFRRLFLADPGSGGPFSALGFAGLLPATLAGADVRALVERAAWAATRATNPLAPRPGANPAAEAGCLLAALAAPGDGQVTIAPSRRLRPLAEWVAYLLETTSRGRLQPAVAGNSPSTRSAGSRRLLIRLQLAGDGGTERAQRHAEPGPLLAIRLQDLHDLGGQLFFWALVAIVAARQLGVNPFPTG